MPLQLPNNERFKKNSNIDKLPAGVVDEFQELISKIVNQGNRRHLLEHFKRYFCGAVGAAHFPSSDEGWAYTDLQNYMDEAAQNPALFIEAFYDGCESLRIKGDIELPDVELMNHILRDNGVMLEINPPYLVRTDMSVRIPAPEPPESLAESASRIIRESIQRSEELLSENRPREAVQEMLWILESISTTFRGVTLPTGTIQGRYFNQIAKELRAASRDTTLGRVIDWCSQLHGYLSSPTGGGVRHGLDLASSEQVTLEEGRLFCNLILSYVSYLMSEHALLTIR